MIQRSIHKILCVYCPILKVNPKEYLGQRTFVLRRDEETSRKNAYYPSLFSVINHYVL